MLSGLFHALELGAKLRFLLGAFRRKHFNRSCSFLSPRKNQRSAGGFGTNVIYHDFGISGQVVFAGGLHSPWLQAVKAPGPHISACGGSGKTLGSNRFASLRAGSHSEEPTFLYFKKRIFNFLL